MALTMTARFGSGREVKRIEDEGLVKGVGRFADDFAPRGHLHLKFLRSPHAHAHAHARLRAINATAAKATPGVIAVDTGAELAAAGVKPLPLAPMFKRPDGSPGASALRPPLAVEAVRFVGEAVAAVVAESAEAAKDALDLIEVDYEPLPAVAGVVAATAPDAVQVWPAATGNIAARMSHGDPAATDAAFARAAHVAKLDIVNQRLNGCHVCEVELDPETGLIEVASYASANDVGRVVNPMIVRGQLDGGAVQGLGQALGECVVFDENGQTLTASFMDYNMPRADLVRAFTHELGPSVPCKTNPLGAKGVGELGTIGATPAAVIAVIDALARAGREEAALKLQMPLTAAKVWRALQGS